MKKIRVDEAHAYSVAFDVYLIILDVIYDVDDKVKIMYTIDEKIIGNITTKKIYYTNKGAYIRYFGRRIYLNEFQKIDFYGMECRGSHK